jgi:Uma2 family endonuclease
MGNTQRAHDRGLTAEEFAVLPVDRAELVDGEVVEMAPVGGTHGEVAGNAYFELRRWAREGGRGYVLVETGYVLSRDPDTVRAPDVSFLSRERVERLPDGLVDGAPDLAVEVLSPGDAAMDVAAKVDVYLAAGCRAVWVVNPRARHVTVHTPGGASHVFRESDALAGDYLPGFSCRVADLFA